MRGLFLRDLRTAALAAAIVLLALVVAWAVKEARDPALAPAPGATLSPRIASATAAYPR